MTVEVPRKCWKLKEAGGDLGLEVGEAFIQDVKRISNLKDAQN